jgi:flagellar motor component MotA
MNKWIITGLIVVGILIIVGVLYDQGVMDNMQWSSMAVILAAVAGPYMAVKNFLFGNKYYKDFDVKYKEMREHTVQHRINLDERIGAKEKRIAELDKEMQLIEAKMDVLELKKKNVEKQVNNLTVEETRQEALDLFGD